MQKTEVAHVFFIKTSLMWDTLSPFYFKYRSGSTSEENIICNQNISLKTVVISDVLQKWWLSRTKQSVYACIVLWSVTMKYYWGGVGGDVCGCMFAGLLLFFFFYSF